MLRLLKKTFRLPIYKNAFNEGTGRKSIGENGTLVHCSSKLRLDGIRLSKNTKQLLWVLYCGVEKLPLKFINSLWFGPTDPPERVIFPSFVDDMKKACNHGHPCSFQSHKFKIGGYESCRYCHIIGTSRSDLGDGSKGRTIVFAPNSNVPAPDPKTHASVIHNSELANEMVCLWTKTGRYLCDLVQDFPIESMHSIHYGIQLQFMEFTVLSKLKGSEYYFGPTSNRYG